MNQIPVIVLRDSSALDTIKLWADRVIAPFPVDFDASGGVSTWLGLGPTVWIVEVT